MGNKCLFQVAPVGSRQLSWPQDGFQDLQLDPSKAQDAPHSLPTWPSKPPKKAPSMAPQALGVPLAALTIALPQTDKPNFEGAAVIPEGNVNPPPPKEAGRDETDLSNSVKF